MQSFHAAATVSRLKDDTGAFPAAKLMSRVGGMVAGADSIEDMDRLQHGVPWSD